MKHMMPFKKRWHGFALLVGFWTIVALMFVGAEFYRRLMAGDVMPVSLAVWYTLGMYLWIPSTLIVLWLVRRFPIRRSSWYRVIPFHMIAAVWNSLFMAAFYASLRYSWNLVVQDDTYSFMGTLSRVFSLSLGVDLMLYLMILVGVHAFQYYNESRQRMLEAADLKAKLAEVQLQALKMQLHPHFLFNAFHTIAMLVRQRREEEAIDMIAGLGTLLRYVLDNALEQKVTLKQELQLLDHYLDVERIRFRDRLAVSLQIDSAVDHAAVPNILLQPLVENAIRHGIVPGSNRGEIEITARREGHQLRIRIRDNGVGLPEGWKLQNQTGIGLANTRLRLERLFPGKHHIDFSNAAEGGCLVNIVIPFEQVYHEPPDEPQSERTALFEGEIIEAPLRKSNS
jgi:signal transduction histidine kinase